MKSGIELIAAERQRQIEKEGWSPEHDNVHQIGELADAALTYTAVASCQASRPADYVAKFIESIRAEKEGIPWPWDWEWFKPSDDPVRNLEKAGALIAAEIDRLQRARADETKCESGCAEPAKRSDSEGVPLCDACYVELVLDSIQDNGAKDLKQVTRDAMVLIAREERVSASLLQRRLRLGYTTASEIIELLQKATILGQLDANLNVPILVDLKPWLVGINAKAGGAL